jgi:sulfur relay (sulfurtransferase) complex TusBCD TusD component (DsrE family)
MPPRRKKLGLLLSTGPQDPNFRHGLRLARAALRKGLAVYLYCIDEAVRGLADPELQSLKEHGLHLYACAYGAQRRDIPTSDLAIFAGLSLLSDLIVGTDRFLSFN